jgi:hypothetical protein
MIVIKRHFSLLAIKIPYGNQAYFLDNPGSTVTNGTTFCARESDFVRKY